MGLTAATKEGKAVKTEEKKKRDQRSDLKLAVMGERGGMEEGNYEWKTIMGKSINTCAVRGEIK